MRLSHWLLFGCAVSSGCFSNGNGTGDAGDSASSADVAMESATTDVGSLPDRAANDAPIDTSSSDTGSMDVPTSDVPIVSDVPVANDVTDVPVAMDVQDVPMACPGEMNCSGICVDTQTSVSNCGACGAVCPSGGTCTAGRCSGIAAPRPLAPWSGGVVTSLSPTFRWELPPSVTGAHVDICSDRACTTLVTSFDVTSGSTGQPAAALPVSRLFYWRLRGIAGGAQGSDTSPVWEFTTGARSAPVDTTSGLGSRDINGDGYADVITGGNNQVLVYLSAAGTLPSTPTAVITGPDGVGQGFGSQLALANVNGDAFADIIVGETQYNASAGRVFVYLGRATGVPSSATTTIESVDGAGSEFCVVATAGDVDGDGYGDVIVGAPGASASTGRAYLFRGSATGLSTSHSSTLSGPATNSLFGNAVGAAGDVDGDGFADVIVGAPNGATSTSGGQAFVYRGGATGLASLPMATFNGQASSSEELGSFVDSGGDLNGDGYADLVVGSNCDPRYCTSPGRAFVFLGGPSGPPSSPSAILNDGTDGNGAFFGRATAGVGDVNGDGYGDFVVGAQGAASGAGRAYFFLGSASGVPTTASSFWTSPDGGNFGGAIAALGDVDGDGRADLAIGASAAMTTGRIYIYRGTAPGVSSSASNVLPGSGNSLFASLVREVRNWNAEALAVIEDVKRPLCSPARTRRGA